MPRPEALQLISADFEVTPGSALPLGSAVERNGVNFAVFSKHATSATLVLCLPGENSSTLEFPLDAGLNRTGNIWHVFLKGVDPGVEYGFRFHRNTDGPSERFFDQRRILLDPYARATNRNWGWNDRTTARRALRSVVFDSEFDWKFDRPLKTPLADSILYELHVRGFTADPSSNALYPGTFAGLSEKIPYLLELGVTAVELMPVCEFDETENKRHDPTTAAPLINAWGYQPLSFFSVNAAYSTVADSRKAAAELKETIRQFHAAGIEVILDVVFNHTGEGEVGEPATSFRGIDNTVYYMVDPVGKYRDFSGCGNTLNCNNPVVREMVLDSLRYWVVEYHVDGFRFDLASALGRGLDGEVLSNPPLLERIVNDPALADVKLIAEAWDAGGLYQVGEFPAYSRWAEWNGKFRDDIRRFVKGDPGMVSRLASRLSGSADLYESNNRQPYHSINFVTCHDGFTLSDLVSYQEKHNERNGEDSRDGANDNYAWNCGAEGPTTVVEIEALRRRQIKNMAALLLLSHGVPMILYGDEAGRTQRGNNNVYCQDNELTWMNWDRDENQKQLFQFFQKLIRFRKERTLLRPSSFSSTRLGWHGTRQHQPDWSDDSHSLAVMMSGEAELPIYVIANAYWEELSFELPQLDGSHWNRFLDTALPDCAGAERIEGQTYTASPRSVVVLIAAI